jgi:hypothetical protein
MVNQALVIQLVEEGSGHTVPSAILPPAIEMIEDGFPGPIAFGQVTPRGTGVQNPKNAVDVEAIVFTRTATTTRMRSTGEKGRDPRPLPVREFVAMHDGPPSGNHLVRKPLSGYCTAWTCDPNKEKFVYKSLVLKQSLAGHTEKVNGFTSARIVSGTVGAVDRGLRRTNRLESIS